MMFTIFPRKVTEVMFAIFSRKVTEVILGDYHQLSVMAVYWEKMIQDEVQYEYGEYENDMRTAENKLYQIMCTMYTAIYNVLHSSIDSYVQRSVMLDEYRNIMNRSARHIRDYIIARDTTRILDFIARKYAYKLNRQLI